MTPLRPALVLALCWSAIARAELFPGGATTHDELWYLLRFRCPYPVADREPSVRQEGGRLVIEFVTTGNVCFTGDHPELTFAVPLGRLPAGRHELELRPLFRAGGALVPYADTPQRRSIRVGDGPPSRLSGLWFDPAVPQQGLKLLLAPNGVLSAIWNTYDEQGQALWLFGQTEARGLEYELPMAVPSGGRFGRPGGAESATPLGVLRLRWLECGRIAAEWLPRLPGFPGLRTTLVQLAGTQGVGDCAPPAITRWRGWNEILP
ncbi:MAG: hypothetical protein RML12_02095 [Xanthomonadales bacterium]|nr:hypothetical protein [Xanthomonadales bacterium]